MKATGHTDMQAGGGTALVQAEAAMERGGSQVGWCVETAGSVCIVAASFPIEREASRLAKGCSS
jgi:hypothetical protein